MSIKFQSKAKYFWNLVFPFILLFQLTVPAVEKKREILINFSDITFVKCNDPEHSHPPLSQRERPEDPEKLVNSIISSTFIVNEIQKYFDFTVENIFGNPANSTELLFKPFPPVRGPPNIEV